MEHRAASSSPAAWSPDHLLVGEWELEDSDGGWLVSYADMLSVVLAMVVLLLGRRVMATVPAEEEPNLPHAVAPLSAIEPRRTATVAPSGQPAAPVDDRPGRDQERQLAALIEERFRGEVRALQRDEGVFLEIAEVVLFDSATADFQASALPILSRLAATLNELGLADIAVEGHTDSRPIQGGRFSSNWELAAARANAVTRFLLGEGFAPERLRSVSFADTRPVSDNGSVAGRAANRRVELRIEFLDDGPRAAGSML
jgi:chemotaxis protein MotB